MLKDFNPRQAVRGLLQSIAPARPLFLPIVFSLGARIENISLRNFLTNPTKITNAQRQIRTHLRSDGVSCYFDPIPRSRSPRRDIEWTHKHEPPKQHWPNNPKKGELPEQPPHPEETANQPRVQGSRRSNPRLKSLLRDEPLLQAGISGPFTLAAQLAQNSEGNQSIANDLAGHRRRTSRRHSHPGSDRTGRSRRPHNLHPRRNSPNADAANRRSLGLKASSGNQHHPLLPSSPSPANHKPPSLRRK